MADLTSRTNYLDADGTLTDLYSVEVCDAGGSVIARQDGISPWTGQVLDIPLQQAPSDTNGTGASLSILPQHADSSSMAAG